MSSQAQLPWQPGQSTFARAPCTRRREYQYPILPSGAQADAAQKIHLKPQASFRIQILGREAWQSLHLQACFWSVQPQDWHERARSVL